MDLTPREAPAVATRRRAPWAVAVIAALVLALGFVVYRGLSNATVYFYNADDAVEQRDDLGQRRFRLQGEVLAGSIDDDGERVLFTVRYNDTSVDVVHIGDPPELFQPGIPVVLEGHWSETADTFESDRILVKHSSEYEADNPDRVDDYTGDAQP